MVGKVTRYLVVFLCTLLLSDLAFAHGGVSVEGDKCILKIGKYMMHFTGYQPKVSYGQEFCEDIPVVGQALIVLDVVDDPLRKMKASFKMVEYDSWPAAMTGNKEIDDKKSVIIKKEPAGNDWKKGTFKIDYDFQKAGYFVGIVEMLEEDGKSTLTSRFPFAVGQQITGKTYTGAGKGIIVVLALVGFYFFMRSGKKKEPPAETPA
jgi:hypothetical protein